MRKKVVQITHSLAMGGLQQVLYNLCRHIDRSMFDVSVIALKESGLFAEKLADINIEVFVIPQVKKPDYFTFVKLARILREMKTDIIHTHNTQPFIDGTLAALLSGVKTIIHTDHSRTFPDKKRYMIAERIMSFFTHKIIGVSDSVTYNLIHYEKIPHDKMLTIHNGINAADYDIDIEKLKKRREIGLDNNSPVIGISSRLCYIKGITYLLKAMCDVCKGYNNVSLVIIGDGPQKKELEQQAVSLGIKRNVYFLGETDKIQPLLKIFDIFVLPSLSEGMPVCLLEAMASGCPIVATNVGGIPEMIENGKNGILVRPADSNALSKAILYLLENEPVRKSLAIEGKRVVREHFSALKMTRMYEQLYLRMI
jgi:sugar transferase (PEP-CTERM/EpsH1 system associated)